MKLKLLMKRALGPVFPWLSRMRHSSQSRFMQATLAAPLDAIKLRLNRPQFVVDVRGSRGMGALVCEALILVAHAERLGLVPVIRSSNPLYRPAGVDDVLSHYLGADSPPRTRGGWPLAFRHFHSLYALKINRQLSIEEASALFWRYFRPQLIVRKRVSEVLANIPGRRFDLSLHYRGTDKRLEAMPVDYSEFAAAVEAARQARPGVRHVFIATDDPEFQAFMLAKFPQLDFTSFNLGTAADTHGGRHFSSMSPEEKAVEALVNSLLLAQAPMCIRTSSYLSALSVIVNPALKTQTLNTDLWGSTTFPERNILDRELADNSANDGCTNF